jgi:hypothetical protein
MRVPKDGAVVLVFGEAGESLRSTLAGVLGDDVKMLDNVQRGSIDRISEDNGAVQRVMLSQAVLDEG